MNKKQKLELEKAVIEGEIILINEEMEELIATDEIPEDVVKALLNDE